MLNKLRYHAHFYVILSHFYALGGLCSVWASQLYIIFNNEYIHLYISVPGLSFKYIDRHFKLRSIATGTLAPPFPGFHSPGLYRSTIQAPTYQPVSKTLSNSVTSPTTIPTTQQASKWASTTLMPAQMSKRTSLMRTKTSVVSRSILTTDLDPRNTNNAVNLSFTVTSTLFHPKHAYTTNTFTRNLSINYTNPFTNPLSFTISTSVPSNSLPTKYSRSTTTEGDHYNSSQAGLYCQTLNGMITYFQSTTKTSLFK